MKVSKFIKLFFFILLVAIIVASSYYILSNLLQEKKQQEEFAEIQNIIVEESSENNQEEAKDKIDLFNLYSINNDIVAWLKIDGTNINYPVMQNSEYYLRRNIYKEYSTYGTPFWQIIAI